MFCFRTGRTITVMLSKILCGQQPYQHQGDAGLSASPCARMNHHVESHEVSAGFPSWDELSLWNYNTFSLSNWITVLPLCRITFWHSGLTLHLLNNNLPLCLKLAHAFIFQSQLKESCLITLFRLVPWLLKGKRGPFHVTVRMLPRSQRWVQLMLKSL